MNTETRRPLSYAMEACDTIMRKFAAEDLPPKPQFHYHAGVFLSGMIKTYYLCKDEKYFQYVKDFIDFYVDKEGEVHHSRFHMDDIQAGVLMYDLYKRTGEEHYKKALTKLVNIVIDQQRTPRAVSGICLIRITRCGWIACIWVVPLWRSMVRCLTGPCVSRFAHSRPS